MPQTSANDFFNFNSPIYKSDRITQLISYIREDALYVNKLLTEVGREKHRT